MEKKINNSKLKIKYIIGSYKDSNLYPTAEDILYELIKDFCAKSNNELLFTNESLKLKYSLIDTKLNYIINNLLEDNIIEIVKNKDSIVTYKVKVNIFA